MNSLATLAAALRESVATNPRAGPAVTSDIEEASLKMFPYSFTSGSRHGLPGSSINGREIPDCGKLRILRGYCQLRGENFSECQRSASRVRSFGSCCLRRRASTRSTPKHDNKKAANVDASTMSIRLGLDFFSGSIALSNTCTVNASL